MFKLIILFLWVLAVWYLYDTFSDVDTLCKAVKVMFERLKNGVCEDRKALNEIISDEKIFKEHNAKDFSMFLWENHERLGISCELVDEFNAFVKQSRFAGGRECADDMKVIEAKFTDAVERTRSQLKGRFISLVTIVTAVFLITLIVLV